ELIQDMKVIIIVNKMDLEQKLSIDKLRSLHPNGPIITTSIKEDEGIDQLEQAIADLYFSGEFEMEDITYVSNVRHIALLRDAQHSIQDAIEAINMDIPPDMVQIDIQKAW